MNASRLRVWVEESSPPNELRFTWQVPDDYALSSAECDELVQAAVASVDGVLNSEIGADVLLVEIDPERVTRFDLAAAIRLALQPGDENYVEDEEHIRVWAEDFSSTQMRVTWHLPDGEPSGSVRQQRRRVAAWLAVFPGVRSAALDEEGVVVRYDPEILDRARIGDDVRRALDDDVPLRERADDLLKRAKIYGNLARKLALDDRISPLPEAAKQAVAARATGGGGRNVALRTAVRFVPGAALISRVQTLLPVLTELSKWSREADPAVVDGHLAAVGLDRDTLRRDTITAHEIRFYARDAAAEQAAAIGERASAGAKQAISAGREMLASVRRALDAPDQEQTSDDAEDTAETDPELEAPSSRRDSSPEDPRRDSESPSAEHPNPR